MQKLLISLLLALACGVAMAADKVPAHPHILVETTEGDFKLELDGKQAPLTVAHFLGLVRQGFYDGTIFHRVKPDFMAQAGGYTPDLKLKEDERRIPNESGNGLSNVRGTIAMARTDDPHSANTQFFINVVDNERLDPKKASFRGTWGYAVFGVVFEGMEVVDKIVNAETAPNGPGGAPMPIKPIIINKMSMITYD
jgi:cyclophilin family peptidyl-prolyl cis-trans isomerase